jgi:RNA ligase (TIGR02306 family)
MTEIKAKVVEYELEKHPNADTLSIAHVKETGWQCVVRTDDFAGKTKAIYFPIDALVSPSFPEFKFLDKNGKGKPQRIKTIRLRDVLSQGLLIPADENLPVGEDFTEHFNVQRYEPPIPACMSGDNVQEPSAFTKYTNIENYKNYPDVFVEGDNVIITEKIHGTNGRWAFVNENDNLTYMVGSHKTAKKPDGETIYAQLAVQYGVEEKLKTLVERFQPKRNLIIFGEVFGWKIQDLNYGCKLNERQIRIFDFLLDDQYQSWDTLVEISDIIGIPTVPLLYRGPYSLSTAMSLRDGPTTLGQEHMREGAVVKADPEAWCRVVGRKIIKFVSDEYLLRKGGTDSH